MMLNLIKKDFLIIRKYVLMMVATTIIIPLFLLWQSQETLSAIMSFIGFTFATFFAVFMLLQYLMQKEFQFPKAATLLCAMPYQRKHMVLSKYCFCLIVYAGACLIYWLETLLIPALGGFPPMMPLIILLAVAIMLSAYFPIQYKLGFEKTRFVFIITIIATPYLLPLLYKANFFSAFSWIDDIPVAILALVIILFSMLCLGISAFISIRIYDKQDLA